MFLRELTAIEQIARSLSRRYGLDRDETEDFVGATRLKIVQDDYAVLRKFRGESSITTYLAMVIATLMRERRVKLVGRWRPSAEARRHGPWAIRLETLVYRNGCTLRDAAQMLRSAQLTTMTDRELSAVLAKLPRRAPLRPVVATVEALDGSRETSPTDAAFESSARYDEQQAAEVALQRALGRLDTEERLLLRLLFWSGLTVAEAARVLAIPQKPLYRRLPRLLDSLRTELEAAGFTTDFVRELIAEEGD